MKRFCNIGVLFIIAVLFLSCGFNFEKPERFGIKTSDEAVYNLAIGEKTFDLGEYISFSSFLNNESSEGEQSEGEGSPNYKLYEYNPETNTDNTKSFLLKMSMQDIPLDLGDSLDKADITTTVDDMNVSKTIEIPNISKDPVTKDVELDVNKKINALVNVYGITKSKADIMFLTADELSNDGFNSIKYKSGNMVIKPVDEDDKILGDIILKKGETELSRASFKTVNGVTQASLPLTDVEIEKTGLTFEFTNSEGISFYARVEQDSIVKEATGLTIEKGIPISCPKKEMEIGNDSSLTSYTIGKGSLSVVFALPEIWTNNGVDYDYKLILSGALEGTLTETDTTLPLDNLSFNNENLAYELKDGFVYLDNATVAFIDEDGATINPNITVTVDVKEIKEAVVKLGSETITYKTEITEEIDLPKEVTDNVKKIKWNEYGFKIAYTNTLPAENPVGIEITSDFFLFDGKKIELEKTNKNESESETETETETEAEAETDVVLEKKTTRVTNVSDEETEYVTEFDPEQSNKVDINAKINFPGYNEEENTITIKNVEPGATYVLDITVTPVLDWESMWINTAGRRESDKLSTGMNLSSIFKSMEDAVGSDVANNLSFKSLPLYLCAETPASGGLFEKTKFNGVIKAYIGDDDGNPAEGMTGKEQYLLGHYDAENETDKKDNLAFRKNISLAFDEKGVVTTDIQRAMANYGYADLATLLNSKAEGSLCVSYDIGLTSDANEDTIEITKSDVEQMKKTGSTTISLSVLGVIRLEFDVTDNISMDLLKLLNKDESEEQKDLLGRTSNSDFEKYEEYINVIKNVQIVYEPLKLPFKFTTTADDEMKLVIDLDGENGSAEPKEPLKMISGGTITLTPKELLTYPLTPSVSFVIPKGTLSIPRETIFDTNLYIKIATSDKVLWLDNIKSNNNNNEDYEGGNE